MPEFLSKQYGPFTGTVWLVVIVGGVGLGLVMRRFMPTGGDAAADTPGATSQGFGGTTFNQGEIVAGVIEAIGTDPSQVGGFSVASIEQRIAELEANRASMQAELQSLKSDAQGEIAGIGRKDPDTRRRMDDLNRRIDNHTARILALREQLRQLEPA